MDTPKTNDEILHRLESQLTIEEWIQLRRGLAIVEDSGDCPPTKRNPRMIVTEPDPQRITVANWPANDEVT
jgi:hypothetical protein